MTKQLFAVYDNKADEIVADVIHTMKHTAQAIRMLQDAATSDRSPIAQHAEDYDLVCLGDIDDQGNITPRYEKVLNAKDLLDHMKNGPQLADGR